MSEIAGRCLCGTVTFQVTGELRDVIDCHCTRCRRFTGHHLAATAVAAADLVVRDDDSNLRWYHPVPEAGYGFCVQCGSSLFWRASDRPDVVSICAGVLDRPTHLHTAQAWWTSEAGDYYVRPDLPERDTE